MLESLVFISKVLLCALIAMDMVVWLYATKSFLRSISLIVEPKDISLPQHIRVSIIIPARNAEDTILRCIQSILEQDFEVLEIVVVDDSSTDRTLEIVRSLAMQNPRIRYIRLDSVPPGWSPKVYALARGYEVSRGDILVFMDSDTYFTDRRALRLLIAEAIGTRGIASYAPRFVCRTSICRAIEVVLTSFSHAFLGFDKVFDPRSKLAWFYGCCWAIPRDVYELLGTHRAFWKSIVEDRDIAVKAKSLGIKLSVLKGMNRVESLWYDTAEESLEALKRIMLSLASNRSRAFTLAFVLILGFTLPFIAIPLGVLLHDLVLLALGTTTLAAILYLYILGARISGYSKLYAFVAPFTAFIIPIAITSVAISRKAIWRDRVIDATYPK